MTRINLMALRWLMQQYLDEGQDSDNVYELLAKMLVEIEGDEEL